MTNIFTLILMAALLWWSAPKITNFIFPPKVDAFYYPDKNALLRHEEILGLKSVSECRNAVRELAAARGDANLTKGDYECGVGFIRHAGDGLRVYQETVR